MRPFRGRDFCGLTVLRRPLLSYIPPAGRLSPVQSGMGRNGRVRATVPRDWFRSIRAKWVVFSGGVAFFVIALGQEDGWSIGQIVIVLSIAWCSALLAVGLDRIE